MADQEQLRAHALTLENEAADLEAQGKVIAAQGKLNQANDLRARVQAQQLGDSFADGNYGALMEPSVIGRIQTLSERRFRDVSWNTVTTIFQTQDSRAGRREHEDQGSTSIARSGRAPQK